MSVYTEDHASALADVAEAGAAVTFTHTTPGTYDATTDTHATPTTSSVTGSAVQADASQLRRAGELIAAGNAVLFFTPTTRGQLPSAGDAITWASASQTVVKTFGEIDPDGQGAFAMYVELTR
jgi:hypothetical protein